MTVQVRCWWYSPYYFNPNFVLYCSPAEGGGEIPIGLILGIILKDSPSAGVKIMACKRKSH